VRRCERSESTSEEEMPRKSDEVVGLFADGEAARRAGRELVLAGFRADDVKLGESRGGLFDALLGEEGSRGTLVQVRAPGRALEAAAILHRHGGRDPEQAEPRSQTRTETAEQAQEGGVQLELVTEDLVPRLEPVEIGEVRVVRRVVSEKRTIEVEVRREEVSVEHHPTPEPPAAVIMEEPRAQSPAEAEPATPAPSSISLEDQVTRVPVFAEQVVVSKRPYVVEEVWIRKQGVVERRSVSGEIRREELEVEPVGELTVESGVAGSTTVRPRSVKRGKPAAT
jgi:stress response protein YsnF